MAESTTIVLLTWLFLVGTGPDFLLILDWKNVDTLFTAEMCFISLAWSVRAERPIKESSIVLWQTEHVAFVLSFLSFTSQLLKASSCNQSSMKYFCFLTFVFFSLLVLISYWFYSKIIHTLNACNKLKDKKLRMPIQYCRISTTKWHRVQL